MPMMKGPVAANPAEYVKSLDGWRLAVVRKLRASVRRQSALDEQIKWGHLVYMSNGPVLLIRAEESRVLLGFWRGKHLRNVEPRLKASGRYDMATLELREGATVSSEAVSDLAKRAIALNRRLGNPTDAAKRA